MKMVKIRIYGFLMLSHDKHTVLKYIPNDIVSANTSKYNLHKIFERKQVPF